MVLACRVASASTPIELSLEEFKMYQHYKKAIEDPRVQKMKPEARLPAIAKDAKYKPKELEKAVARGEAAGDVKAACEGNIKEALAGSDLKGRVAKIDVDADDPHAVASVQWLNEKPELLVTEASLAAARTASACPIASTIVVFAQDQGEPEGAGVSGDHLEQRGRQDQCRQGERLRRHPLQAAVRKK